MIIAGDVAIAPGDRFEFRRFPSSVRARSWCINLEGPISTKAPRWGIANSSDWLRSFSAFRIGSVFIGNNHILDIDCGVSRTISLLKEQGIDCFGAGSTVSEAKLPALTQCGDVRYALIGFGWDVIGCKPAAARKEGVNRFEGREVRDQLSAALKFGVDRVVVVLHANYEFEPYPQPGHRRLAHDLIAEGAYAVIFHHPHVVGPVERVRGRTIAYSVGNWAFSYGRYFGGKLSFPGASFHQIAVELGEAGDTIHHAKFVPPSVVEYSHSEQVCSEALSLRAEFEGFDDAQYREWFARSRKKRKLLPIYVSADDSIANAARSAWLRGRQVLIDGAVKMGLKAQRRNVG